MLTLNPLNVGDLASNLHTTLVGGRLQKSYLFPDHILLKFRDTNKQSCYLEIRQLPCIRASGPSNEQLRRTIHRGVSERLMNTRVTDVYQVGHDRILRIELQKTTSHLLIEVRFFTRSTILIHDHTRLLFSTNRSIDNKSIVSSPDTETSFESLFDSLPMQMIRAQTACDLRPILEDADRNRGGKQFLLRAGERLIILPFEIPEFRTIQTFSSIIPALNSIVVQQEHLKHRATEQSSTIEDTKHARMLRALERQRVEHQERIALIEQLLECFNDLDLMIELESIEKLRTYARGDLVVSLDYRNERRVLRFELGPSCWNYTKEIRPVLIQNELFEQRKASIRALRSIERRAHDLERSDSRQIRVTSEHSIEPTKILWFERENYRFCLTSDGHLALLGRNAPQNEELISKHLEGPDRFCHAEFYGAPHLVLKQGETASDEELEEACTLAFLFTNRWQPQTRHGLSYWTLPSQVSKNDPAGHRLPEGQFYIEGIRNYIQLRRFHLTINQMTYEGSNRLIISINPLHGAKRSITVIPSARKTTLSKELAKIFQTTEDQIRSMLPPGYSRIK